MSTRQGIQRSVSFDDQMLWPSDKGSDSGNDGKNDEIFRATTELLQMTGGRRGVRRTRSGPVSRRSLGSQEAMDKKALMPTLDQMMSDLSLSSDRTTGSKRPERLRREGHIRRESSLKLKRNAQRTSKLRRQRSGSFSDDSGSCFSDDDSSFQFFADDDEWKIFKEALQQCS